MDSLHKIRVCKKCLYTEKHPLGITFNDDGICSGCQVHEEKDNLDWDHQWHLLAESIRPYRSRDRSSYDCIIPVTGGADSYFIVHIAKECLGLNPLLVTYNRIFNTPLGIRNLQNLKASFDCDLLIHTVNPETVKRLTRVTLRRFGSMYWPVLAGQSAFAVQTAVRYQIPLIIWGAHQGTEQVGMFSHTHLVEMTRRYRHDHDLMGYEADDLLNDMDCIAEADIWQYRYPCDTDIDSLGVRGIYLSNFIRWDPKAQHESMIERYGYKTCSFSRTFDTYDHVDCFNYMNIHDYLKYMKHGYSKVTDHACREIRHGRLSRMDGLALVDYYENQPMEYSDLFCEWLGIHPDSLGFICDQFRSPEIWKRHISGEWTSRLCTYRADKQEVSPLSVNNVDISFCSNSDILYEREKSYITIGRGYPF